ncbi:MAG: hypothetical protein HUU08_06875 [Candidatus Brocadia sp.]|nr:hypothetical protein [Candidatus Brocadia sp.]
MNHFAEIINNYRNKGILIDTSILLMYFIGNYNKSLIPRFKRTNKYVPEDYELLTSFIKCFTKIITTPNILTEVSNFSDNLEDKHKTLYFSEFTEQLELLYEFYTPSQDIGKLDHFAKYGLTDSGIIYLVKGKYLVLSDDFPLVNYLQSKSIDAINFTHLRPINW